MPSDDRNVPADPGFSAAHRVYVGIMQDLERRRIVPGQRLVESDLASAFGVGRNAVREAMQRLAARGVIDLTRHRSGTIRKLDLQETMEVLDVTEAMTCLAARAAAIANPLSAEGYRLAEAMSELAEAAASDDPTDFSRARRHFYRALLAIGGNRELQRLFPAVGMHIIYSQFQSKRLRAIRLADYAAIHDAVISGDVFAAEKAGRDHVCHVRAVIVDLARSADARTE